MSVAPGHAHLPASKFLQHDKFLAPRQFRPRHCASAHLLTFCYRDSLSVIYQLSTATLVMLNKISTLTAKTRAIPSLHRDNFSAKEPGPCPVRRQVTQPPFIAVPLAKMPHAELASRRTLIIF